jgi:hypothetical protein
VGEREGETVELNSRGKRKGSSVRCRAAGKEKLQRYVEATSASLYISRVGGPDLYA